MMLIRLLSAEDPKDIDEEEDADAEDDDEIGSLIFVLDVAIVSPESNRGKRFPAEGERDTSPPAHRAR